MDDRILDAARRVFLEHGLDGASIDEIARLAHAGKPTIYARFPTKEALFRAMTMRNATAVRAQVEAAAAPGGTVEERLVAAGSRALERLLDDETVSFMRLAIAEVRRFPELAEAGRMARDDGTAAVTRILGDIARTAGTAAHPSFVPGRVAETSRYFVDLVVAPFITRALSGEPLDRVRADIGPAVKARVRFFLAAVKSETAINV